MIKFLVVEQDLRISGTSQGIISRSFLSKLRTSYPDSQIDVVYLKRHSGDDQLGLLPVDSIDSHILNIEIPIFTRWTNKLYWRLFHISLREKYINNVYASYISKIEYGNYDYIFIRSAGLNHETILGSKNLPILKKAIINFHDPFPVFWYAGSRSLLTNLELFRLKEMEKVVSQAKTCMSSAYTMSKDMQFLFGSKKKFYTLPHQYSEDVFDLSDIKGVLNKKKKITISYHGAIQFGRDICILLDAYENLLKEDTRLIDNTEFVLRLKGMNLNTLRQRYKENKNITILETLNFSNSAFEQKNEADINIILENGPLYSNILVGKAPFLSSINKPILVLSPERSELRRIIKEKEYIASYTDQYDIEQKLKNLILKRMKSNEPVFPFGNYFSTNNFKSRMDEILFHSKKEN